MTATIVVSGSGRMGSEVIRALAAEPDLEAVAVVDALAEGETHAGLPLLRDAAPCLDRYKPDIVIDFTNADWTPLLAREALPRGVRLVTGTTGLADEFIRWLEAESRRTRTGAVVAANFALGAVLMMHFARLAAPYFESAEIIELHHDQKVDSPSGTAKTTAEMMVAERGRPFRHRQSERETLPGARGAETGGVAVHSVRLPGLVAHQEVIFGGTGQTLTIRHDSTGRDSFMPGVMLAARRVLDLDHLVVGLDTILGLSA